MPFAEGDGSVQDSTLSSHPVLKGLTLKRALVGMGLILLSFQLMPLSPT